MRDTEREFSHNCEVFISWTLDVFNKMQQYTELAMWVFQLYSPISSLRADRSRSYRVIQMRKDEFKNPYIYQKFFSSPKYCTPKYFKYFKYIDFYQPFIVKKSAASCNMHPVQVMENTPKPELKILAWRRQKSNEQTCQAKGFDFKSMVKPLLIDNITT